jgi:hypothetical protein
LIVGEGVGAAVHGILRLLSGRVTSVFAQVLVLEVSLLFLMLLVGLLPALLMFGCGGGLGVNISLPIVATRGLLYLRVRFRARNGHFWFRFNKIFRPNQFELFATDIN